MSLRSLLDRSTRKVPATSEPMLRSCVCREQHFTTSWYSKWVARMAAGAPMLPQDQLAIWGKVWEGMRGKWLHRKLWEWAAISQALDERGALAPSKTGIGFAVGREPLPSLFAARGARIVASDFVSGDSMWQATGQMGESLQAIHWPGLIPGEIFRELVTFQCVDMRSLSDLPKASFDFAWSSCSFEHLGTLEAGAAFIRRSMDLIKPAGVAVHTTEFNVSSNTETIETGPSVIYRRRDIEALDRSLRLQQCGIEALEFETGTEPHDLAFDFPPYYKNGRQDVKILLDGHVSTSIVLIIRKS
jgi:Methyltransferase domain